MRQWWTLVALGAVAAMVVATPAAAAGGGDGAPRGATERVTEQVQTQNRLDQTDVVEPGDQDMDGQRERIQLRDATREGCVDGCVGDQIRDRDQLRDGSGEGCVGRVGDQDRNQDRMRRWLLDHDDGCEAAWCFAHNLRWTMHLAI
jgi:hypothetical protein